MKIVFFPQIVIPDDFVRKTDQELEAMRRPLSFCPTCRYVLCSCGNCHNSQLCNEECLKYDQEQAS